MKKVVQIAKNIGFSGVALSSLVVLFVFVLLMGWNSSVNLRNTVAANAAVMNVDSSALIELERLRNLAESQITNSRAYFLLGSKSVFEKQEDDKKRLTEGLAKFVTENSLPQVSEIAATISNLEKQEKDIFEQAIAFREKSTESKIVAQFYHSKTSPMLTQLNEQFDALGKLQKENVAEARARAQKAGDEAQSQIPKDMLLFITALSVIFACVSLLVIQLLITRRGQQLIRDRLYADAQKSALDRDDVIAAVTRDMKEPIASLEAIAKDLPVESAELVQGVVSELNSAIADIVDQKRSDMGGLTLSLEQLSVSSLLNDAKQMLSPLAKKRDVTLQFDVVNASVLAYADRDRVLRVIANLVDNAVKFSPKNSRIQIKVKSDAQFANISVIDNGTGIAESRLSSIFENFWQAPRTADQGPGIGLAIVKTIITAHGGTVRAEKSFIGGGSVFTFSLPRRRPVGVVLKKPSFAAAGKPVASATRSYSYGADDGPSA